MKIKGWVIKGWEDEICFEDNKKHPLLDGELIMPMIFQLKEYLIEYENSKSFMKPTKEELDCEEIEITINKVKK